MFCLKSLERGSVFAKNLWTIRISSTIDYTSGLSLIAGELC